MNDLLAMTIEDVEGLIAEVVQAQPMLTSKRNTLLNRLMRVRNSLELLAENDHEQTQTDPPDNVTAGADATQVTAPIFIRVRRNA